MARSPTSSPRTAASRSNRWLHPSTCRATPRAYTSLAYVKAGSEITSLDQAKGKKVCFVDAASTSGFLVPTKGLMDVGLVTKADITPVMAGGLFWADERVVFTGSRYITRRRAALPCWESGARHAGELPIL
jgi:ABC-type phosphate/phosphonate transport system substrate-binding protein